MTVRREIAEPRRAVRDPLNLRSWIFRLTFLLSCIDLPAHFNGPL